jgi:DNA-directed RNA polymerase specialized sigma24 family protein
MSKREVDRSERLLALLLLQQMKAAPQRDKVLQLNVAGFSNLEIADLLGMTGNAVAQALHQARKPRRPRSRAVKS